MLCPSMTSGSFSAISFTSSWSIWRSVLWRPSMTWLQPRLSESAIRMIRSDGRDGVAEAVVAGGVGLDVELEPVQVLELHPLAEGPAGLHEELHDGVGEQVDGFQLGVGFDLRYRRAVVGVQDVADGVPHGGPFLEDAEVLVVKRCRRAS